MIILFALIFSANAQDYGSMLKDCQRDISQYEDDRTYYRNVIEKTKLDCNEDKNKIINNDLQYQDKFHNCVDHYAILRKENKELIKKLKVLQDYVDILGRNKMLTISIIALYVLIQMNGAKQSKSKVKGL